MIPALVRFVESLRNDGLDISPAELLDASRAVEAIDVGDRDRFRTALRATLAKDREQAAIFDRAFGRFFATPRRARRERHRDGRSGGAVPGPGRRDEGASRRAEPSRERRAGTRPSRAAEEVDRPSEPWRAMLRDARATGERRRLRRVRLSDHDAEAGHDPHTRASTDPSRRDLQRPMPTEKEREIAAWLPRMIDELRLRRSRRRRRHRHGALWTRRLFRDNLAHGGVPFVLPRRRPRRRRAAVVLLVDVSLSSARATGFFLWMAASFLRPGRKARVVLFVDRPVDATRAVAGWMSGRLADPGAVSPPPPRHRAPALGIAPAGRSFADLLESIPRSRSEGAERLRPDTARSAPRTPPALPRHGVGRAGATAGPTGSTPCRGPSRNSRRGRGRSSGSFPSPAPAGEPATRPWRPISRPSTPWSRRGTSRACRGASKSC